MTNRAPRVSVVMPVYNGQRHLAEAIESVLDQTFSDFELIAVDDASSDDSWRVLEEFAARDARIRPVHRPSNGGHHVASNQAMALARGEYLARLDQDDLALPRRLEQSVEFLDQHPEVGLLHTGYRYVTTDGRSSDRPKVMTHEDLRCQLVFGNCICHSSVVLRREIVEREQLEYRDLPGPQDYDLWMRTLQVTTGASLPEPLAVYRRTDDSMSDLFDAEMPTAAADISDHELEALIGDLTTDHDVYRSMRRLHALHDVREQDQRTIDLVLRVYERLSRSPELERRAVLRARRRWIVRACSTIARDPSMPNPSPAFVAAVLRHDPLALALWGGVDVPRRTVRLARRRALDRRRTRTRT